MAEVGKEPRLRHVPCFRPRRMSDAMQYPYRSALPVWHRGVETCHGLHRGGLYLWWLLPARRFGTALGTSRAFYMIELHERQSDFFLMLAFS